MLSDANWPLPACKHENNLAEMASQLTASSKQYEVAFARLLAADVDAALPLHTLVLLLIKCVYHQRRFHIIKTKLLIKENRHLIIHVFISSRKPKLQVGHYWEQPSTHTNPTVYMGAFPDLWYQGLFWKQSISISHSRSLLTVAYMTLVLTAGYKLVIVNYKMIV